MLRRPPGGGRWSSQQQKLLLAFAFILIPWLQLADAQQQPLQPQVRIHSQRGDSPLDKLSEDATNSRWYAAQADDVHTEAGFDTINRKQKQQSTPLPQQHQRYRRAPYDYANKAPNRYQQPNEESDNSNYIKVPSDASALATLAPAQSVRAPHTSRHHWPSSSASGLASPQNARSLEDWEVEDFVLLATVDGDLYASDRRTGRQRWHLEVDQPVVETKHYRTNNSVLDDDYSPVDHYIWAVEPSRDGGLYVWIPDAGAGLVRTGFTMKRLVEDLAPYAGEEPPVVYTGDKKTTMVTLDVATGRVLKWFGSSGSHVNEGESCLRPSAFGDKDSEECSSMGTITLGRTEYTVGIQRRDGRPIATLKYAEWGPNTFDSDLYQQYHASLDSRYITSQHDGKVYAFDHSRTDNHLPLFSHKFSSPVARVFDVCRPWDPTAGSNPELIVLPQPPMPSQDESIAKMRSNSIFLNQTENGSWYALSGRAYPLIIDAPVAQISRPDWWDTASAFDDTINRSKISKALVGTHFLDPLRSGSYQQPPTLPAGALDEYYEDLENGSNNAHAVTNTVPEEPTIITKVKALPQSAANSIIEFVSNPILIILFVGSLIYNEKKLRRSYHRFRTQGTLKDIYPFLTLSPDVGDESGDEKDGAFSSSSSPHSELRDQKVEEISKPKVDKTVGDEDKDKDKDSQDSSDSLEPNDKTDDKLLRAVKQVDVAQDTQVQDSLNGAAPEKKKKAHRGRRGGVKHKKNRLREGSQSREDDAGLDTVDEAVSNAKKLGDRPSLEPDIQTIYNDMQAVTGSIISMGNIEVDTDIELGMGSNGTVVFAGRFDGRDVAVKRMTIQFYDIATRETRLLRESDDHPNGKLLRI
jgi:serine/threonine-protein kinase/endoribonuclease IRE1